MDLVEEGLAVVAVTWVIDRGRGVAAGGAFGCDHIFETAGGLVILERLEASPAESGLNWTELDF